MKRMVEIAFILGMGIGTLALMLVGLSEAFTYNIDTSFGEVAWVITTIFGWIGLIANMIYLAKYRKDDKDENR